MPAPVLSPSERAPGLLLGEGVTLADDVEIGGNVVIHAGTTVGPGAQIQDGAILGKPLALGAHSHASREPLPPLVVEAGGRVRAGAGGPRGSTIRAPAEGGAPAPVRQR